MHDDVTDACPREARSAAALAASLESRIDRLEHALDASRRSARRLRFCCVGALVAAPLLVLFAAAPDANTDANDLVRARRIELVDTNNKVIGLLSAGSEGGQLDLWTMSGTNAARITAANRGGDLSVWNGHGAPAIGIFAGELGGKVETYDGGGKPTARIAPTSDGGSFEVYGRAGKPAVIAKATDVGGGFVACDVLGRPVAEVLAVTEGGAIAVSGRTGPRLAGLTTGPRGGELRLADTAGVLAISAGADTGGGSITSFSGEKKPIFTLGPGTAGGGEIAVRNAGGTAVVTAAAGNDGGGRFVTATSDGEPSVVAQGASTGGLLGVLLNGRRLLFLEANAGGGRLEVSDGTGTAGAAIGIDGTTKSGTMSLRNEKGQESLRLGIDERGSGALTAYNRAGTERKSYSAK